MRFEKRASKCPSHGEQSYRAGEPIVGDLTFQRLAMIISWVCFGLTILLWLALVVPHLRRYKFPNKQRQMFRIVTTPLIYSLFALASIYAYDAAPYLEQVPELYEAYALASLFLLYVHYVTPDTWTRNEFFHNLDRVSRGKVKAGGSLKWFRVCSFMLKQPILMAPACMAHHLLLRAHIYNSIHRSRGIYW